jgi:hypothetical protein
MHVCLRAETWIFHTLLADLILGFWSNRIAANSNPCCFGLCESLFARLVARMFSATCSRIGWRQSMTSCRGALHLQKAIFVTAAWNGRRSNGWQMSINCWLKDKSSSLPPESMQCIIFRNISWQIADEIKKRIVESHAINEPMSCFFFHLQLLRVHPCWVEYNGRMLHVNSSYIVHMAWSDERRRKWEGR